MFEITALSKWRLAADVARRANQAAPHQNYRLTTASDATESHERARGLLNPGGLILAAKRS